MAHPLQRHPRYAQALGALGVEATWLPVGTVVTRRVPVLGTVRSVSRGVTEEPDALRGLHVIDAEAPSPALALAGFVPVLTPAHVAELQLMGSPEGRRQAMDPKWRGHVNAAGRRGLRIEAQDWDGDPGHWLLRAEAAQRRARRYRATPQALACAWAATAGGAARLYEARDADGPVAGMLALLHPPGATYQIGWTGARGRAASAHHRLLAAMADDLSERGFSSLDLGTVDSEANPGLALFKLGSGARLRRLGGSWLRLPRPLALRARAR
jgi:hypothetical protein